ncbi:MAG: RidA family protein [Saprospiraceae bacterium]|nr:RidA family protein [Candidatus Opimibacter skivensis]
MKKAILTTNAPAPIGPYSQAIQAGDTVYISGQIAIDPSTGDLITSSIEEETHQVLKNVGAILEAAGLTYENVVSCSVFIKDMELFGRINAVYTTYFSAGIPPARALVQVSDLPKHVNIEISAIAHI